MYHSDHDNAEASKRAMEYLENSMYKDKLGSAGLYYAQLVEREKALKALNSPRLGIRCCRPMHPWMNDLEKMAPKLNWDDLTRSRPCRWAVGSRPTPGTTRCIRSTPNGLLR